MELAIDTSTEIASIAIGKNGDLVAELTWRCGQNHSIELMPRLADLLKRACLTLSSVTGVVVAKGPGSYNGLRVGVSTAKGLAFSLGIPVVGISTLEVAAYQHAETGLPVCAISNAGRGEIATALYQKKGDSWLQLAPESITTLEALLSQVTRKTVFCGEFIPAVASQIRERLGQKAVIPPAAALLRRATFLMELGQQRLRTGNQDNPATLQPLYLRRPPITRPKRGIIHYHGGSDELAEGTP